MLALLPITKVYPSGAARATASAPTLPFAPTRFSTTTGWPRLSESFCATTRAARSEPPPAGNATTILIAREG